VLLHNLQFWGQQMTKPGRAIFIALMAMSILWPLSSAHSDQAFQRFIPLLIDLDGWQGKKPDGMSMEMPNNSMTTATREYQRGSAQLHAGVVTGQAAVGAMAPLQAGMKVETPDGHMISSTVHGLSALKSFNTKQKSGAILIALGKEAMFTLSYNGITEDEALALADKFDWKAIQAAAQTK
jgi:hypothetical protein